MLDLGFANLKCENRIYFLCNLNPFLPPTHRYMEQILNYRQTPPNPGTWNYGVTVFGYDINVL